MPDRSGPGVPASRKFLDYSSHKGWVRLHFFFKSAKKQEGMLNCCLPRSDAHSPLLAGVSQNNGNKSDVM